MRGAVPAAAPPQSATLGLGLVGLDQKTALSGRHIILICELFKTKYTLVNVYLPNVHQIRFLSKIWKKVEALKQGHVILTGDFSAIPNKELDLSNPMCTQQRRATLSQFLASSNLFDVWRCQHSSERDFTFFFF